MRERERERERERGILCGQLSKNGVMNGEKNGFLVKSHDREQLKRTNLIHIHNASIIAL